MDSQHRRTGRHPRTHQCTKFAGGSHCRPGQAVARLASNPLSSTFLQVKGIFRSSEVIFERLHPSNLPEASARCQPEADAGQQGIARQAARAVRLASLSDSQSGSQSVIERLLPNWRRSLRRTGAWLLSVTLQDVQSRQMERQLPNLAGMASPLAGRAVQPDPPDMRITAAAGVASNGVGHAPPCGRRMSYGKLPSGASGQAVAARAADWVMAGGGEFRARRFRRAASGVPPDRWYRLGSVAGGCRGRRRRARRSTAG